jgi:hypothetical protein
VFFHEQTAESLVDAMRWLEAHPQQFPATLARQQALRFDAERYERELIGLLDSVLREQRGRLRRAA